MPSPVKHHEQSLDWIFFDAGNTLITVEPSVAVVYAQAALPFDVSLDPQEVSAAFASAFQSAPPLCFPGLVGTDLLQAERLWWRDVVEKVVRPTLFSRNPQKSFDAFFHSLYESFRGSKTWRVYDDVFPTLQACKNRGISLGIISNFDSRLPDILRALNLAPFFEKVFYSTQIGFAKPDRRIFEAAFPRQVSRQKIAMVGDDHGRDIQPALAMGAKGFLVRRKKTPDPTPPGSTLISTLSDLVTHLAPAAP